MKRIITIIIIFSAILVAQEKDGKFVIGLKAGYQTYFGDIDDQNFDPLINGSLAYWVNEVWGFGLNGGWGFLKAAEEARYFETDLYNVNILAKFAPFGESSFSPYLTAGAELFNFNPKQRNGDFLPNREAEEYGQNQFAIPIGLGFNYFVADNFSLDLEGLIHVSATDYIDDIETGDMKDNWVSLTAGLSIHFGTPKDSDNDGIPDKKDADPLRAEDFDGFQDKDGQPDPDNDQDGVLDINDKEPNNAEDIDGFQDEDGIPDPDNDFDGIPDSDDLAPNDPEDKDGFEDEDGKPDFDNDGDGIVDEEDGCPNEAETFNDYEDTDGCPDEKPEIAVEAGSALVLEGVNFASGSNLLSENSKTTLDKVFRTLKDNPKIQVEIRGYTDNTGNYNSNVNLSLKRAEAVKIYLVEAGISPVRIQTKGFGPENPIAPNNTSEGRAKNRRIEFYRIK